MHITAPLVLPGPQDLSNSFGKKENLNLVYVKIPYVNTDFSLGRIGIENAAKKAGLNTVLYVDYEYRNILGYFKSVTIHAYGY